MQAWVNGRNCSATASAVFLPGRGEVFGEMHAISAMSKTETVLVGKHSEYCSVGGVVSTSSSRAASVPRSSTASAVYYPQKGWRVEREAMLGPMQSKRAE